jgi:flavodoxin I
VITVTDFIFCNKYIENAFQYNSHGEIDMKTGIFYGSTTGNTEAVAIQLGALIQGAQMNSAENITRADLESCDLIILGASTWGLGDLQDDWIDNIESLRSAKLQGKMVALFGLGDQNCYPDTFIDGIRVLHDAAVEAGASVVGFCPDDGYDYSDSAALIDGKFCGLPLDQENQSDLTEGRVTAWVEQILKESA